MDQSRTIVWTDPEGRRHEITTTTPAIPGARKGTSHSIHRIDGKVHYPTPLPGEPSREHPLDILARFRYMVRKSALRGDEELLEEALAFVDRELANV